MKSGSCCFLEERSGKPSGKALTRTVMIKTKLMTSNVAIRTLLVCLIWNRAPLVSHSEVSRLICYWIHISVLRFDMVGTLKKRNMCTHPSLGQKRGYLCPPISSIQRVQLFQSWHVYLERKVDLKSLHGPPFTLNVSVNIFWQKWINWH